jgi:hypothetical protein
VGPEVIGDAFYSSAKVRINRGACVYPPRLVLRFNRPRCSFTFATRMVWSCDGNGLYSFGTVGLYFRFVMTNGAPVLDASTERGSPELIIVSRFGSSCQPIDTVSRPDAFARPSILRSLFLLYSTSVSDVYLHGNRELCM